MHTLEDIQAFLNEVRYLDYSILALGHAGALYMQGTYPEADIVTGNVEIQHTRKWKLSRFMTKSEIIQTAFKLCLTSAEHRTREHFRYKGKAIFGPHFDVDALHRICSEKQFDYREPAVEVTVAMVNELRTKSDAPMMECKKALTACNGNMERAEEYLRSDRTRMVLR